MSFIYKYGSSKMSKCFIFHPLCCTISVFPPFLWCIIYHMKKCMVIWLNNSTFPPKNTHTNFYFYIKIIDTPINLVEGVIWDEMFGYNFDGVYSTWIWYDSFPCLCISNFNVLMPNVDLINILKASSELSYIYVCR